MYRDPSGSPISFGDIFKSDHLIDIFVQSDSGPIGGGEMPRPLADKLARAVGFKIEGDEQTIPLFTPAIPLRKEQFDVRGQSLTVKEPPVRAILISDNCAVDSVFVVERKERRAHGRLLFAPIVAASADRIESLQKKFVFGRFPLPESKKHSGGAEFAGGVADLSRCFMADGRAVTDGDRVLGLTAEAAEDLEAAWHAYALRRGPIAISHNLYKLAQRLGCAVECIGEIEAALALAWRLEGDLRAAVESQSVKADNIDALIGDLEQLSQAAAKARQQLNDTQQE